MPSIPPQGTDAVQTAIIFLLVSHKDTRNCDGRFRGYFTFQYLRFVSNVKKAAHT